MIIIILIYDFFKDLSHYEYEKMVTKSMMLLNRYYSSYDNLFKRAVQAQVIEKYYNSYNKSDIF